MDPDLPYALKISLIQIRKKRMRAETWWGGGVVFFKGYPSILKEDSMVKLEGGGALPSLARLLGGSLFFKNKLLSSYYFQLNGELIGSRTSYLYLPALGIYRYFLHMKREKLKLKILPNLLLLC